MENTHGYLNITQGQHPDKNATRALNWRQQLTVKAAESLAERESIPFEWVLVDLQRVALQ